MDVRFDVFGEVAQETHIALGCGLALLSFSGLGGFRGTYYH